MSSIEGRTATTRKVPRLLAIILICFIIGLQFSPPGNHYAKSKWNGTPIGVIPNHSVAPSNRNPSKQVNVHALYSSEPAPMGVADYGIGPNGPYEYSSNSFLGIARVFSLSVRNSTGYSWMSFQMNLNLQFQSSSGQKFAYWVQNVAQIDTSNNAIFILNNVWNQSATSSTMNASAISGNGQVAYCNCSVKSSFYYARASSSLPGTGTYFSLPLVLEFEVNSSLTSLGQPQLTFAYNDGYGWQNYDTFVFSYATNVTADAGFLVSGFAYNPYGVFNDAEMVMGGPGGGENASDIHSNVQIQLQYWNGHNYQAVPNSFNFGSDTAEGIQNVLTAGSHDQENGSIYESIAPGFGTLGTFYDQGSVSSIGIQSTLSLGTLFVINSSYGRLPFNSPGGYLFTSDYANVTVSPGGYAYYLYAMNGTLEAEANESVLGGQYLAVHVTTSPEIPFTINFSFVGSGPPNPPTITYVSGGARVSSSLGASPSVLYLDQGSSWSVPQTLDGNYSMLRWETNQSSGLVTDHPQTITVVYYEQYYVTFNYTIKGGGSPSPSVEFVSLAQPHSIVAPTMVQLWADTGSSLNYTSTVNGIPDERWISAGTPTLLVTGALALDPVYYHQYFVNLRYHGKGPVPGIAVHLLQFSVDHVIKLNTSSWIDSASNYSFPQTLGNASGERWEYSGNLPLSGTFASPVNMTLDYTHQFHVTIYANETAGGRTGPISQWYNASSVFLLEEKNNSGWGNGGWRGFGNGSYTGPSDKESVIVSSPFTEEAIFLPSLKIGASSGGFVQYSYGSFSGNVSSGGSVTLFVPEGTTVSLSGHSSSLLYSFRGWSANQNSSVESITKNVTAPAEIGASFQYNYQIIAVLFIVPAIIVAVLAFAFLRVRRKSPERSKRE